jgi:hypothetical protein
MPLFSLALRCAASALVRPTRARAMRCIASTARSRALCRHAAALSSAASARG